MAKRGSIEIHGNEYELVWHRIERCRADHPDWTIQTDLLQNEEKVVFKASILDGDHLIATGHADETHGAGRINATSALENCETSAIGRALRNAGYGNDKPSQEEMDAVHGGDSAALTDKDIKYVKKAWLEVFPNDQEFKHFTKQVKKNVDDLLRTDTLKPLAIIINKYKKNNKDDNEAKGPKRVD